MAQVHLATFSDESMSRSARLCIESARRYGVDNTSSWDSISAGMLSNGSAVYENLMKEARGAGYWVWKPAIILHGLRLLFDGDILIYSDVGVEFIAPISHIIHRMDQDIFLFGNNWEHAHWCKRDVIEVVWPQRYFGTVDTARLDYEGITQPDIQDVWIPYGKQVQASVIFFRVSDYSRRFVKEWLDWCLFEGGRLIDDSPSRLPNHPEFREHRHDQAILTTMAYREGISLHYWPAVYNLGYPLPRGGFVYEKLACYAKDDYPSPLFHHHRRRNVDWERVA